MNRKEFDSLDFTKKVMAIQQIKDPELLEYISEKPFLILKELVAGNPNTSYDTLSRLSKEKSSNLLKSIVDNPNCDINLIWKVYNTTTDIHVRKYISDKYDERGISILNL